MKRLVENPRLLLCIALFATAPLFALTITFALAAKGWDPLSWQHWTLTLVLFVYQFVFVFFPIMIVIDTHFPKKKRDDAVQGF